MKMPKNRRVEKEICWRLGSSGAEKMSAAQNLPRVKLFKRELGSRDIMAMKMPKTGELWKMSVIDWVAQARRRCRLPKIFLARSYLRGNWAAEDIMAMKMLKTGELRKKSVGDWAITAESDRKFSKLEEMRYI